jgi:hypothetical protein
MGQRTDGDDARYLRICFDVAHQSRSNGRHPFGAILVGPGGVCAGTALGQTASSPRPAGALVNLALVRSPQPS